MRTAIELADNLEDRLLAPLTLGLQCQQPADAQVHLRPFGFRDQRIRRLMDAIMHKPVGTVLTLDQLQPHRRRQCGVNVRHRHIKDCGQRVETRDVAQAGQLLQRLAGFLGQPRQFADHQIDDIVGVALAVDQVHIPPPALARRLVCQQLLLGQGVQKLDDEERIASGLVQYQPRQRDNARRRAAQ